jgi:hypothetical protein
VRLLGNIELGEPLREHHPEVSEGLCRLIGVVAVLAPALHILSEVLEILAGGFYSGRRRTKDQRCRVLECLARCGSRECKSPEVLRTPRLVGRWSIRVRRGR